MTLLFLLSMFGRTAAFYALIAIIPTIIVSYPTGGEQFAWIMSVLDIPQALAILLGGLFAMRFGNSKTVHFALIISVASYFLLYFSDAMILVLALIGLLKMLYYLSQASWSALLPHVTSQHSHQNASTYFFVFDLVASFSGPLVASLLGSISGAVLFSTAMAFLAAVIYTRITPKMGNQTTNIPTQSLSCQALIDVKQYILKTPLMLTILMLAVSIGIGFVGPFYILLPQTHIYPFAYYLTAFGIGGFLSIVMPILKLQLNFGIAATGLIIIGSIVMLLPFVSGLIQVLLLVLLAGIASSVINIYSLSLLYSVVPDRLLSGVMSLLWFISLGLTPLYFLLTGSIQHLTSTAVSYLICGALIIMATTTALFLQARRIIHIPRLS
jgi:hypothetical protein